MSSSLSSSQSEVVMADPQVVDTSENQEEEVQQEIDLLPS
jgi:hypothetical protein